MKKITTMFSILIISISISACSSKTFNTTKLEGEPLLSTTNIEKPITNSYEELDKLPQIYNSELAQNNGDVVNSKVKDYNIEKLDKFIENYKNKKANVGDMVRITKYTTEGDAIICDLIIDSKDIKLVEDSTRDKFSNTENRKKIEYQVIDIFKENVTGGISYMAKTDKGEDRFLFFQGNIDIRELVWNQLDLKDKERINGNWQDAKLNKILLNESMGIINNKLYIGKEVYIIDFQTKGNSIPNNMIVYSSIDEHKIIGYGYID